MNEDLYLWLDNEKLSDDIPKEIKSRLLPIYNQWKQEQDKFQQTKIEKLKQGIIWG